MLRFRLTLAFLALSLGLVSQNTKDTNSRILVGSNFDFFDSKAKASNLYGEVNLFYPDIITTKFLSKKAGFICSIYENKTVSQDTQNFPFPIQTLEPVSTLPFSNNVDSIEVVRNSYYQTSIVSSKNFGFQLSPTFRVKHEAIAGQFDASVFLSLHLEGIYQVTNIDFKYEEQQSDTATILFDNTMHFTRLGPDKKIVNSFQLFLGIGSPFWFKTQTIDFRVLPSVGMKIPTYDEARPTLSKLPRSAYGLVSFSLMERKIGVTLGGEIRGTVTRVHGISAQYATVSLYLAKAFNLEKLSDLLRL